jgi:hypothetical protein
MGMCISGVAILLQGIANAEYDNQLSSFQIFVVLFLIASKLYKQFSMKKYCMSLAVSEGI